ncbi:MAG TPA: M13 family metallopeptidase [Steroidobacteraceae bacterium]|nr:M13 family metallopeptidase [Steroidobacteraceae bacterium]
MFSLGRGLMLRLAAGLAAGLASLLAAAAVMAAPPTSGSAAPLTASATPAGSRAAQSTDAGASAASDLGSTVAPGDDFFRYANGAWLAKAVIPPDRSSWGTFAELAELTLARNRGLISAAAGAAPGTQARKVGDYYAGFMDEATIERLGLRPLQPGLQRIEAIRDRAGLARALGETLRADVDILNNTNLHTANLFGLWVARDLDDPARYSPFLLQGGLELPDRDYYLDPSPKMADIRARYQAHIAAVLRLAQTPEPEAKAARIFELERRIAAVHWSREDSEQVLKGDNHWTRADFGGQAPGLDWAGFFAAAGLAAQDRFVVWQPSAVQGISALTAGVPLADWKDYLRFHFIESHAAYLPRTFVEEQFAFYGRVLSGTPQLAPRWKRAVDATNEALGEAVGRLYVARYFPAADKARAQVLVQHLLAAFARRIDNLRWMSPQTRAQAQAKLAALQVGVGYPDRWRDYSGLEIRAGDAFGNADRAQLFEYRRNLAKLGHPVDRGEWAMTPQLVNAVNLPAMNALNFPAAILQPPFFDPRRDIVMDYGGIGAIIGHEISHSFDDQGALFDAGGRLHNWWTKADFEHFRAAGRRLAAQFSAYHPFPDVSVNGVQTLSENIADVAGLSAAYDAWHSTLDGRPAAAAGGYTAEQLFFISFAHNWRSKTREAALRRQIVTDGHAPAQYRADTVRNLDAWYAAFDVRPGQRLYLAPADRVRVW